MAQHDYSIANATGFNFRTDLNNALAAVVTQNSGSTAPSPSFPGQLWLDLSGGGDGIMRRRNQANSAWLTDIGVDQTARNAAATAQAKADRAILRDNTATVAERTMVLPLILPNTVPANHEAVSRTQGDLLYQVRLPTTVAGALLVGAASGWTGVLPPASDGGLIVQSGGVPVWQNPATAAAPNSIVRTLADGTIDPSFIPAVASGLRYRGTFKPVVNDEYPAAGDNGSGPGGAPAIGDFWVIDGLTTGGYTFLTGSLAGVTVFNGDSIAFDGAVWFRMGSTINLQGYLRADGTVSFTGDQNAASHQIINLGGLVGRAGPQVPLTNFRIDQTSILISPQRGTTGADLAAMQTGQIGTDLGRMQLFVGAAASNTGLIPVRYFSSTSAYAAGEHVYEAGQLWKSRAAISAGAFTASQWLRMIDEGNGYFIASVTVQVGSFPAVIFSNTGNAADKTRASISVENTTGDAMWGMSNDANTLGHGGIRIVRANGAVCGTSNAVQPLGYSANRWNGLYLANNIDMRGNVLQVQMGSPNNTIRYTLMANITDSVDGGFVMSRWNGSAYEDKLIAKSEGIYLVHALPLVAGSNVGSDAARWNFLYCKSGVEIKGNVNAIVHSSDALGNRYRVLVNISDSVDGGYGIQRWDGSAFQDQILVRNLNALTRTLYPMFDNQYQCGGAGNRWTALYAVSGTINTSDEREKTPFASFTPEQLAAADDILDALGMFQFLDDSIDGGRENFGVGAQTVNGIFTQHGLNPEIYALVQHDVWEEIPPEIGPDGEVMFPGRPGGDRYGMRYDQLAVLLCATLHRRLKALEAAQSVPPTEEIH